MRRFRAVWIVAVLFLLFTAFPGAVGYATDWLWFREVGYQSVFVTELIAKIVLFVVTAIVAYCVHRAESSLRGRRSFESSRFMACKS